MKKCTGPNPIFNIIYIFDMLFFHMFPLCIFSYSRHFLILGIFFIIFDILFFQFLYFNSFFFTNSILSQYIHDIKTS